MYDVFHTTELNKGKMDEREWDRHMKEAMGHLEFCAKIYELQVNEGSYVVHEHPLGASSWGERCMQKVSKLKGVRECREDMCACGLTSLGEDGVTECALRKPTKFVTNSDCMEGY